MFPDPKRLSELIRSKKNKLLGADPEVVDTKAPMNANDVANIMDSGRIEETLGSPEKSNSDKTNAEMSEAEASTVGLTPDEMKRMARLRNYLNDIDLSEDNDQD